ncbi:MAG TPA: hypothetical protein VGG71_04940, partial [Chitinophagaceae bacterium]
QTTNGEKYEFNKVWCTYNSKYVRLFNIVRIDPQKIIEVSVYCENKYVDKLQVIFFSIIPNLFVDGDRFINTRDVISKIR